MTDRDPLYDLCRSLPGVTEGVKWEKNLVFSPYLAKHSWIRLESREALPREFLEGLIERSHELVAAKLSKKLRASLGV